MNRLSVRIGDTDLGSTADDADVKVIPLSPEQIVRHPDHASPAAYFDVAVVNLDEPLAFNDAVWPVCLPRESDENTDKYGGHLVRLIGAYI